MPRTEPLSRSGLTEPRPGATEPRQLSLFDAPASPLRPRRLAALPPGPPSGLPPGPAPNPPWPTGTPRHAAGSPSPCPPAPHTPPPAAPAPSMADTAPPAAAPADVFRHPAGSREIVLDGHAVAYALRRARRRSIGFAIGADGLTVSAPRWVGLGDIEAALRAKAGWVVRKLHEQAERQRRAHETRIEWRDGASFPFLGETVTIALDPHGPATAAGAILDSRDPAEPGAPRLTLHVGLPRQATAAQVRDAVHGWLQRQARRIFDERCRHFAERLGVRMTRLSLSAAATRWGSASADGSIRLNWRLVHLALPSIDYVVAHELAHLREMNHSAAFWEVVQTVIPDYRQRRQALRDPPLPVAD